MSKNVFIFGAGFTAPAGMPLQSDIMSEVVRRYSQPFQDTVRQTYTTLFEMVEPEDMQKVPLEDVFTMLDRARRTGETIRGLSHAQIADSCDALIAAVRHEFNKRLRDFESRPYEPFFAELVRKRRSDGSVSAQADNPLCIITLNWDTICDFMIDKLGRGCGVIADYACYDYDLAQEASHVPSLLRKASGKFNVKLLKLHGSLNWLVCTCCGRLFSLAPNDDRPPVAFPSEHKCSFCEDVQLESLMVTPTLLKDIGHTHLKMVWHNALMDLQEAERLVFVGYSLPLADFEFRYTLLKAITGRHDVKVRVVLYPPDGPDVKPQQKWDRDIVEERYLNFFGQRDVDFKYLDSVGFMSDRDVIWNW